MLPASVDTILFSCWASVTGVGSMAGMVDTLKTRSLFKHTCSPEMPKQDCKPIFKPTLFQLCFKAGNVGPAIIPCYLNIDSHQTAMKRWLFAYCWHLIQGSTTHPLNIGLILGQRRRRWPNNNPTLSQPIPFARHMFMYIFYILNDSHNQTHMDIFKYIFFNIRANSVDNLPEITVSHRPRSCFINS